jgi:hypothetical protein
MRVKRILSDFVWIIFAPKATENFINSWWTIIGVIALIGFIICILVIAGN